MLLSKLWELLSMGHDPSSAVLSELTVRSVRIKEFPDRLRIIYQHNPVTPSFPIGLDFICPSSSSSDIIVATVLGWPGGGTYSNGMMPLKLFKKVLIDAEILCCGAGVSSPWQNARNGIYTYDFLETDGVEKFRITLNTELAQLSINCLDTGECVLI